METKQKFCHVMVGLPASGKSTMTAKASKDIFVYSSDAYIESVAKLEDKTYNDVFMETIKPAIKVCEVGLTQAIVNNQDVIWDQTNLTSKKRKVIVERMTKAGYTVVCQTFSPAKTEEDIAEWNRRLESRPGKTIPPGILKSMKESYQEPTLEEGFDTMIFIDIYGEMTGLLISKLVVDSD